MVSVDFADTRRDDGWRLVHPEMDIMDELSVQCFECTDRVKMEVTNNARLTTPRRVPTFNGPHHSIRGSFHDFFFFDTLSFIISVLSRRCSNAIQKC
jgi:hypothetical protein